MSQTTFIGKEIFGYDITTPFAGGHGVSLDYPVYMASLKLFEDNSRALYKDLVNTLLPLYNFTYQAYVMSRYWRRDIRKLCEFVGSKGKLNTFTFKELCTERLKKVPHPAYSPDLKEEQLNQFHYTADWLANSRGKKLPNQVPYVRLYEIIIV